MPRLIVALLMICSLAVPARAQQQRLDPTWLSFDPAAKTARFQLIAGLTGLNGALNFNGFRDGELTLVLPVGDRKSTRLNSSHLVISYAVFCLKKKKN